MADDSVKKSESYFVESKTNEWLSSAQKTAQLMSDANKSEFEQMKALNDMRLANQQHFSEVSLSDSKKLIEAEKQALINYYVEKARREEKALDDKIKAELAAMGPLTEAEFAARRAALEEENKAKREAIQQQAKDAKTIADKAAKKREKEALKEKRAKLHDKDTSKEEKTQIKKELKESGKAGEALRAEIGDSFKKGLDNLGSVIGGLVGKLDSYIDTQAKYKSAIDTRLQGFDGKHWDDMSKDLIKIAGTSPIVKQADLQQKIADMVGQGIAFNVEQRAVLDVMKDKIATTFQATNSTLLRLVKIQQQDTTAGRLGMESALTSFLNNMYQTTEYMENLASQVKSNLEDAMALMSGENAVSFEYQVQKWLGSMSSVGMSDSGIGALSSVIGQIASGKLEGITSGGAGNLVVMAANNAGLNVADMMAEGLDESSTNKLMRSMVDYLAKIYEEAGNNKVIQQQFASIYGLSAADLKAVSNLASSRSAISNSSLTYASALGQLNSMASSAISRTSMGEMLTNVQDNMMNTLARGISTNPALYGIYKGGKLLKDLTGGIDIPAIQAMGTGISSGIGTVADIMMTSAMAGGLMSNIAGIASSLSSGLDGKKILRAAGLDNSGTAWVTRGTGASTLSTTSGSQTSESGANYYANSGGGSDLQNKILTDTNDNNKALVEAYAEENVDTSLTVVDEHVIDIYKLLKEVVDGTSAFNVTVSHDYTSSSISSTGWSL